METNRAATWGEAKAPLRPARYWTPRIEMRHADNGVIYVRQVDPLPDYPTRISDRLVHWADVTPDAVFVADRGRDGAWRRLTYAEMLDRARRLGQAVLDLNLTPEHPLLILSGNDIEHAQLALACILVGVPYAPVSEAYSLISTDFGKLRDIIATLTPGAVFAADGEVFARPIAATLSEAVPVIVTRNPARANTRLFADLAATEATEAVERARLAVGAETIAKFLFTSGSTGSPKAVINTNRMISASQTMVRDCYAFMQEEPPTVLDWAPWNHTAGGNKVFFMVMFNGGSLYVDDGRPTPRDMGKTIRNLREIAPTWYFNVPKGYEELVHAFKEDAELRDHFFSRVKMLMYAGAGLARHTCDDLETLAVASTGERVLIAAGLGSTETAPFALMCTFDAPEFGNVGVPSKGLEMKLAPVEDKLELRLKGPSITPGYWKEPELTARAFDEDGFYRMGDALRFADPDDPSKGFYFDGRTAENFKLSTGTWVHVGPMRARLVNAFAGLVRDAVLTGINQDYIGALVFPDIRACQALAGDPALDGEELVSHPNVRAAFAEKLWEFSKTNTGSSTLVRRIIVLAEPPQIDKGEVTDKGSINQRAVLRHRAHLADEIYEDSFRVIHFGGS